MSKVYVYESCIRAENVFDKKTYIIQTEKVNFIELPNVYFKDNNSKCWVYIGEFDRGYIPPVNFFSITYNGNYFSNRNPIIFPDCNTCLETNTTDCKTIYFSCKKCSTQEIVEVKMCDIQANFSSIKLVPEIGQICGVYNPNGDDFCVEIIENMNYSQTDYEIITSAWEEFTCEYCPILKSYTANSCNGTTTGITIYDYVQNRTKSIGDIVSTYGNCYSITSYNGIVCSNSFIRGNSIPIIVGGFQDCVECISNNLRFSI